MTTKIQQEAIAQLVALAKTLPDIVDAPAYAPDQIPKYPYVVAFPETGTWTPVSDWKQGRHTFALEIHCGKNDLARAIEQGMKYSDAFPNLIFKNRTLNGTVDSILDMRYTFGKLEWNGIETIGWHWSIDVNMESAIT